MSLAVVAGACQRDERAAQESGSPVAEVAPVLWTIRYPPLHEYDPQLAPNVQNVRLGAPLVTWIVADERSYKSAIDCEQARTEQYVREYGRRTASVRLYLDAVGHAPDAQVLAVLHRRAAEDSGHDDQLDNARCLDGRDVRLGRTAASIRLGTAYLLVPPTEPGPGEDIRKINTERVHLAVRFEAPLSRWSQLSAFDTIGECDSERARRLASVDQLDQRNPKNSYSVSAAVIAAAVCVGPTDQRLNGS